MRTANERALWATACGIGRSMLSSDPRRWLVPLDYVRNRELPAVVDLIDISTMPAAASVLDISSPQILSLHLASANPEWKITYLNPFSPEIDAMIKCTQFSGVTSISPVCRDARIQEIFKEGGFDLILSASVLEHVHDCDGQYGDSLVMKNCEKWLKPNGRLVISVPYTRVAFDEYRDEASYAEVRSGFKRHFFQRFYDHVTFDSRIQSSVGLVKVKDIYIGERWFFEADPHTRLENWIERSPYRYALGRAFPWIAQCFLQVASRYDDLRKPYIRSTSFRKV